MIYFRAEVYRAHRDGNWQLDSQVTKLPLFETADYRRSSLIDRFAVARYLVSRTRPPREGELALIRASYIGAREGGLPYTEKLMECTGLDMLLGSYEQQPALWQSACAMADIPAKQAQAAEMLCRLSGRFAVDGWDSVLKALRLGLKVKAQNIAGGEEAEVKLVGTERLHYRMADGETFDVNDRWPTHHLYIAKADDGNL